MLIFVSQLTYEILSTKYAFAIGNINNFILLNKLPVFIASLSLFLYIKNLKIESKLINHISQTSLGVYLIHDNYFIRIFLWRYIFKNNSYYHSNYLFIHSIISITFTFIICVIIDIIRIKIFENNLFPLFLKMYNKFIFKIKQSVIYKKIINKSKKII